MLGPAERSQIDRLWARKLDQDLRKLGQAQRHRNLEPSSAAFLNVLATTLDAKRLVEIGGSSGISTIALAAAARATGGKLLSIEIEASRQAEARETLDSLDLSAHVELILGDAATVLPTLEAMPFTLIDCEKEDYIRFFDMLKLAPGSIVVADNILSHDLSDYTRYVRSRPGIESMTLPIGKGLEITRIT